MAKKPLQRAEYLGVTYDEHRWHLLRQLREKTIPLMEVLQYSNLPSIVHGSVARGDVNTKSDIDVFIPEVYSSFLIETTLERRRVPVSRRFIVQATPSYALKAYIEIDVQKCVSFPLVKLRPLEREFYRFAGEATLQTLKAEKRVFGVDKRLMLIEPTPNGHRESSVVGREEAAASLLRVSAQTVLDRVRALSRRDAVGRTGVFIERELSPDENFGAVLKRLAEQNPAVRRRIRTYGT